MCYLSSEELVAEEIEGSREDNPRIVPRLYKTQHRLEGYSRFSNHQADTTRLTYLVIHLKSCHQDSLLAHGMRVLRDGQVWVVTVSR